MTITLDLNKNSGVALDLTKNSPNLKNVKVLLNWDEHPVHGANMTQGFDLDLWAFALNSSQKVSTLDQICYFNNMNLYNGAVVLPRDNRTGVGDDDEEILINLDKIPADISSVVIYAFIYEGQKRGQNFGMVANANVKIINVDTNDIIAQYNITQNFNGQTAICLGAIDKNSFTPDGGAGVMEPNEVMHTILN